MSGDRQPKQVYVYAIGNSANSLVKIGSSNDPEARMANLQCGSPVALEILRTYEQPASFYGESLEFWLHRQLKHLRRHGEWFALGRRRLSQLDLLVAYYLEQEVAS